MDQRRRGAVLAASGAVIAASTPLLLGGTGHGSHSDFWRGFGFGLALALISAATVLMMRAAHDTKK